MKTITIISLTFFCLNFVGQVIPEPPPNKITVVSSENDVVYDVVEEQASLKILYIPKLHVIMEFREEFMCNLLFLRTVQSEM